MENNEINPNSPYQPNPGSNPSIYDRDLVITPMSGEFLRETAKWAKFLSILGLIGMGFYLIMVVFFFLYSLGASTAYGNGFNTVAMLPLLITAIIVIALYIAPIWWLYKFGTNLTSALNTRNNDQLTTSFQFLKRHYKFIGIMAIVMLGLYILSFIGLLATGFLAVLADKA